MLYEATCKKCGATLKDAGNDKAYCVRCGEIYPIQSSTSLFGTPTPKSAAGSIGAIQIGFQLNGSIMDLDAAKLREKRKMEMDLVRIRASIESEVKKLLQACWDCKDSSFTWSFTGAKIVFDSVLALMTQKGFTIQFIVKPEAAQNNAEAVVTGRVKIVW